MADPDPFELQDFLPYLLNQAAEASSLAFQQMYRDRYGILRAEWRVLFHLGLHGRMTAGEIARRSKTHKTKISRAVHRLSERRFISRSRDSDDRRMEHLALTVQGWKVYEDLRAAAQDYDAGLRAQLTPQELALLRGALKKLTSGIASPPQAALKTSRRV